MAPNVRDYVPLYLFLLSYRLCAQAGKNSVF